MKANTKLAMLFTSNSYKAVLVAWLCFVALQDYHSIGSIKIPGSIKKAAALGLKSCHKAEKPSAK